MMRSFTDRQRALLLAACTAVLYTPQREHFGIVPLEAMAAGRPVIACNSGGPLESVVDGCTGFLRPPTSVAFAEAMQLLAVQNSHLEPHGRPRLLMCTTGSAADTRIVILQQLVLPYLSLTLCAGSTLSLGAFHVHAMFVGIGYRATPRVRLWNSLGNV